MSLGPVLGTSVILGCVQDAEPNELLGRGLANPRLSDLFDLVIRQDQVSFVIPHVREDLPLALDPFLLWQSESTEYQDLHKHLISFADFVCGEAAAGRTGHAMMALGGVMELAELGLGYAVGSKKGSAIGPRLADRIVQTIRAVPQLVDAGFSHIEIIALLVPHVAEDRISDVAASVLLEWLVEFTQDQCNQHGVPTKAANLPSAWDADRSMWRPLRTRLPWNPTDEAPLLLAPLDLLRRLPWINYDDYYKSAYAPLVLPPGERRRRVAKEAVLAYNRTNFRTVEQYVQDREAEGVAACKPDPLFKPLALETIKKKLAHIRQLPTGREGGADKKYEDLAFSC